MVRESINTFQFSRWKGYFRLAFLDKLFGLFILFTRDLSAGKSGVEIINCAGTAASPGEQKVEKEEHQEQEDHAPESENSRGTHMHTRHGICRAAGEQAAPYFAHPPAGATLIMPGEKQKQEEKSEDSSSSSHLSLRFPLSFSKTPRGLSHPWRTSP